MNGFRRFKPDISIAGSCSVAISAAFHPPDADEAASVKKLLWGLVKDEGVKELTNEVGNCSFTSLEVTKPVTGKMYAGFKRRKQD